MLEHVEVEAALSLVVLCTRWSSHSRQRSLLREKSSQQAAKSCTSSFKYAKPDLLLFVSIICFFKCRAILCYPTLSIRLCKANRENKFCLSFVLAPYVWQEEEGICCAATAVKKVVLTQMRGT